MVLSMTQTALAVAHVSKEESGRRRAAVTTLDHDAIIG
jgi:hypothetical protein